MADTIRFPPGPQSGSPQAFVKPNVWNRLRGQAFGVRSGRLADEDLVRPEDSRRERFSCDQLVESYQVYPVAPLRVEPALSDQTGILSPVRQFCCGGAAEALHGEQVAQKLLRGPLKLTELIYQPGGSRCVRFLKLVTFLRMIYSHLLLLCLAGAPLGHIKLKFPELLFISSDKLTEGNG